MECHNVGSWMQFDQALNLFQHNQSSKQNKNIYEVHMDVVNMNVMNKLTKYSSTKACFSKDDSHLLVVFVEL